MDPKENRRLVWHDEFEGDTLDPTKWHFQRSMSGADRVYDNGPDCVQVKDGFLRMIALHNDDPEYPFRLPEGLSTKRTMVWKYGYVEMCGRVPYHHAAWPSFWMQSATPFAKASYMAETDIFEVFSSPDTVVSNIHKWGNGEHSAYRGWVPGQPDSYTFPHPETLNGESHTYGLLWTPESMAFFADGICYANYPIREEDDFSPDVHPGMQGFHDFAYLLFNNELFTERGGWVVPGWNASAEEPLPVYDIEWVRLYQGAGEELRLAPEIAAAEKETAK